MVPHARNPIEARERDVVILDGGLASTLESHGYDLDDPLWSARLLLEEPEAITRVHTEFLEAGADCITSSTYQATFEGLAARGLTPEQAASVFTASVRLAVEARDAFWAVLENRRERQHPLVAASIGPYGAFLADGSEYTGNYELSQAELVEFHRGRWQVLIETDADLLACETIPSRTEALALITLLRERPDVWAWLSFSCRDGEHICDGTPLRDVASWLHKEPNVAAVGINCTAPRYVASLIDGVKSVTDKPVLIYPNSGERYDARLKRWEPNETDVSWHAALARARPKVAGIGGCCRIGPEQIAEIAH